MEPPRPPRGAGYGREMSRAERFEEEKRRIVDSCFLKKDVEGAGMEDLPLRVAYVCLLIHSPRC